MPSRVLLRSPIRSRRLAHDLQTGLQRKRLLSFVYHLSHSEVNQEVARDLGAEHGLAVQTRFARDGLPDGDCRALIVDLDSVAPDRLGRQRLVKELSGRTRPYPVAVFSYNLEDGQAEDLRAAGVRVFGHGLGPELFRAIAAPPGPQADPVSPG
jgi:hypothetical protein